MPNLKYYLYISDLKINMFKNQIKCGKGIKIDFKTSLKIFLSTITTKISTVESPNIYRDLEDVLKYLKKKNKIGTFEDLDNFNYQFIKITEDFDYSKSLNSESPKDISGNELAPHCRFIHCKDYGAVKRLIYLVGSMAYLVPRRETQEEIKKIDHHLEYIMHDLGRGAWETASYDIVALYIESLKPKFVGIKQKFETTFLVIHRSAPYTKEGIKYLVTLGTPIYVTYSEYEI